MRASLSHLRGIGIIAFFLDYINAGLSIGTEDEAEYFRDDIVEFFALRRWGMNRAIGAT